MIVPKWNLDYVSEMNVILFSSFARYNHGPAIDSVPTDTATYPEVHTGYTYANTLSNFIKVRSGMTGIGAETGEGKAPTGFVLYQNHPNPFNPTTTIRYTLPGGERRAEDGEREPFHTTLKIYNILGQEVRMLVDELKEAGRYSTTWDGKDMLGNDVASGIYFCRLQSGRCIETKRIMLLR